MGCSSQEAGADSGQGAVPTLRNAILSSKNKQSLCRVGIPDEAFSSAGIWDAQKRKLTVSPQWTRGWAYYDTSAKKEGLLWGSAGATLYNFITSIQITYEVEFNEVSFACAARRAHVNSLSGWPL